MVVVADQAFESIAVTSANFVDREFYECTFKNCDFSNLNFSNAKFFNTTFINCNLANSNLSSVQIADCVFKGCKLIGIGLSRANFAFSANFYNCDLQYAEFIDLTLRKMLVERCNCKGIRFMNCNLRNSLFTNCSFVEAIFSNCDMQEAAFTNANSLIIDPSANKIKKTKIDLETASNIARQFGFQVN